MQEILRPVKPTTNLDKFRKEGPSLVSLSPCFLICKNEETNTINAGLQGLDMRYMKCLAHNSYSVTVIYLNITITLNAGKAMSCKIYPHARLFFFFF